MKIRLALSHLLLFLCVASSAYAQRLSDSERIEMEKSARKACIVGNYTKGVDILADLFISVRDPVYIYNQGRCFQQNHQWQSAIDRFDEYLRKAKGIPETEVQEVKAYIAECEGPLGKTGAPPETSPPPPPTTIPPAAQPTSVSAEEGSGLRTAGVVVGAIGVAGLAAGVFCSVKSYQVRDHSDQLNQYKTAGYVSYGVGAAGLVTGITLYLLGHAKKRAESTAVALVPRVGPDQTAVFVQGTF
jgi:hypothetical protein